MQLSQPTLAVTNKYRWRLRTPEQAPTDGALSPDVFVTSRRQLLYGGQADAAEKSLLSLLPDPSSFKDIDKAVARVLLAIENAESITLFGDYDVDGTTSCAMLRRFFLELNVPVQVYIPERLIEGYGLNPVGLEKIKAAGGSLVITVDNGISAVEACRVARTLGLDVIITDHHDLPPVLPDAFAILNPKQLDCKFPFKMLAGVGVAFYLMAALRAALRRTQSPHSTLSAKLNLRSFLDYVALGTIADMAPLDGVNHVLCRVGLEVMYENVVNGSLPGVEHLLALAGWKSDAGLIDASDVGFKIGPRLNAAGRLGNALATEELLSTFDSKKAFELAEFLHSENAQRQALEKEMVAEAMAKIARLPFLPPAFVLHEPHWHPGVVGLVASRVLEKYYRPTLVLGTLDGKLKGSGRSTHAFDLFGALNEVRHEFVSFGGHFHAVGCTLEESKLEWLQNYLAEKALERLNESDCKHPLDIDGCMPMGVLVRPFFEQLERFEPFGIENPRPKWLIRRAKIRHIKRIGKSPDSNHARVTVDDGSGQSFLTAFDMFGQMESAFVQQNEVDLVVEGRMSFWNGQKRSELRVIDFVAHSLENRDLA